MTGRRLFLQVEDYWRVKFQGKRGHGRNAKSKFGSKDVRNFIKKQTRLLIKEFHQDHQADIEEQIEEQRRYEEDRLLYEFYQYEDYYGTE